MLAEFGVIFLGITLSLLADDWRTARTERVEERTALSELLSDLADDQLELSTLRDGAARHDRDAWWIFERLDKEGVNADSAAARFGSVHDALNYEPINATYAGLRSTGRLALVRDDDLRRSIVRYFEERQEYVFGFVESYAGIWLAFTESAALDIERAYSDSAASFSPDGRTRLGWQFLRPWGELPSDPMFRYRITTMGTLAAVIADRSEGLIGESEELQEAIRRYLES
ncbi:MAG: hypothetical protein P8188_01165 [Gemmatimonadota bacterium]